MFVTKYMLQLSVSQAEGVGQRSMQTMEIGSYSKKARFLYKEGFSPVARVHDRLVGSIQTSCWVRLWDPVFRVSQRIPSLICFTPRRLHTHPNPFQSSYLCASLACTKRERQRGLHLQLGGLLLSSQQTN